jgi:hypothetical protein
MAIRIPSTTPWHEIDITNIDIFRSLSLSSLLEYTLHNKKESLDFAKQIFDTHEEESYDKAIQCMSIHQNPCVPVEVLQHCFKNNDTSTEEALYYLKQFPNLNLNLSPDIIAYIERITKIEDIDKSTDNIEKAIDLLLHAKKTPSICNFFENLLKHRTEILKRRELIQNVLQNIKKSSVYGSISLHT